MTSLILTKDTQGFKWQKLASKARPASENANVTKLSRKLEDFRTGLGDPITIDRAWLSDVTAMIQPGEYLRGSADATNRIEEVPKEAPNEESADDDDDDLYVEGAEAEGTEEGYTGNDVVDIEGTLVPIKEWLGVEYTRQIALLDQENLQNIPPIMKPIEIASEPHPWQLRGASRLLFLAKSSWRGGILGDEMGLGKTLAAILAINAVRYDHGAFSLVVTTKSCIRQWVDELNTNLKPEHKLKVFVLKDPKITATQLLLFDVVVTTYQFVEHQHRTWTKYASAMKSKSTTIPERPVLSLFSELYADLGCPIKMAVLDEAQYIKKVTGSTHVAFQHLFPQSTVMLSGTFLDNKWSDCWGLIDFLKGHPIQSLRTFNDVFATRNRKGALTPPSPTRMRRLQKFLLAVVVARPGRLLDLPGRVEQDVPFNLDLTEEACVEAHMDKYHRAKGMKASDVVELAEPDDLTLLAYATRALQASCHPLLECVTEVETEEDSEDVSEAPGMAQEDWLKRVREGINATNSSRVRCFLALYRSLKAQYPTERVLIWSVYLRFLDIVDIALGQIGHECLRYDGRMNQVQRAQVQKEFVNANGSKPLLLTAGAGGVGLNIAQASIVIQMEVWWNRNTEKQAYARAHRQGQLHEVKIFRLCASNSSIDSELLKTQRRKTKINEKLMKPLLREDDEQPSIPVIL